MPGPETNAAPPAGGVFRARTQVLSSEDVSRALTRIAHEIVERNRGVKGVVLVGLQTGGVPLAYRLADLLASIGGLEVPVGKVGVALYRDDVRTHPVVPEETTDIPVDLSGRVVVLVDDVICTGRTVRAALGALADHGRACAVQLAVMIDRGHRELPIKADYVGKNLPTRRDEFVEVSAGGVSIGEMDVSAAGGNSAIGGSAALDSPGSVDVKAGNSPGSVDVKAGNSPGSVDVKAGNSPGSVNVKAGNSPGSVEGQGEPR